MATLNSCKAELRSIIGELNSIEAGIRSEFSGIGEDLCADCISGVIRKYEYVLRRLERVDTNFVADWVHGEG